MKSTVALGQLSVCHVISGDLWAGAEVQTASLLRALGEFSDLRVSAVLFNQGRLEKELQGAGVRVTLLDESRNSAISLVRQLQGYFRETTPDLIHAHRYKEHILGAVAAKLSDNPIVVQTFHGLDENLSGWAAVKMAAYGRLNTVCGKVATDGFIGVSAEIASVLGERYAGCYVRCIRNGLDFERVKVTIDQTSMREKLGIPAGCFVVGAVGRLAPIKGIEYLVKAMAVLGKRSQHRERRLVLVGEGPSRALVEQLVREAGISRETLVLGARTDVYDIMSALDMLAIPSVHEGIPMVLLEAMAIGVPVVASRVGGIPEVVSDRQEAYLVPARDEKSLADAIERLETDSTLRDRLRTAALHRMQSEFTITRTAGQVRDMYRELVIRRYGQE